MQTNFLNYYSKIKKKCILKPFLKIAFFKTIKSLSRLSIGVSWSLLVNSLVFTFKVSGNIEQRRPNCAPDRRRNIFVCLANYRISRYWINLQLSITLIIFCNLKKVQ